MACFDVQMINLETLDKRTLSADHRSLQLPLKLWTAAS